MPDDTYRLTVTLDLSNPFELWLVKHLKAMRPRRRPDFIRKALEAGLVATGHVRPSPPETVKMDLPSAGLLPAPAGPSVALEMPRPAVLARPAVQTPPDTSSPPTGVVSILQTESGRPISADKARRLAALGES